MERGSDRRRSRGRAGGGGGGGGGFGGIGGGAVRGGAAAEVLALPVYPELRDDEQQTVVEAIRNFYAEPTPPIAELTSF